jgi:hypothetical protein
MESHWNFITRRALRAIILPFTIPIESGRCVELSVGVVPMPGASQAIALLLVGTGISGAAYVASQKNGMNYEDSPPSGFNASTGMPAQDEAVNPNDSWGAATQPSSSTANQPFTNGRYGQHWYNSSSSSSHYYYSGSGNTGFAHNQASSSESHSFGTEHGGFGSTGHAHASASS